MLKMDGFFDKGFRPLLAAAILLAALLAAAGDSFAEDKIEKRYGPLSAGGTFGVYYLPHINDFKANYPTARYTVNGNASGGFFPFVRLDVGGPFALEAVFGYEGDSDTNLTTSAASLLIYLLRDDVGDIYLKGGAVHGEVEWDDLPGSFEGDTGWQAGAGMSWGSTRVLYSMDLLYRSLKNRYIKGASAQAGTSNEVDLSGYGAHFGIKAWF